MTRAPFTIRNGREDDLPYLNAYAFAEGMDSLPSAEAVRVAVNDEDVPVGFLRIRRGDDGVAHVNPVVTCATWRGWGVGRALVEEALERFGELRLVARGESIPFYRALGFQELGWDDIASPIASECDGCEMYGECQPLPMGRRLP
ncbi:GNAT family N-acetyltransferase [Adlercreutzia sp. R25]|uniref:GNAT family N-acetyltransferase n=1 Tax=Adlercreutzia shanghongiae TaxID=3111773 RepID=A0ABU6IXE5_9ACTN|nr:MULTISPECIES: GNAT family N-acetyltransferase [unclassified Adlercreutzia]MEC4272656.1 GNAT family N-acetyltransferase [Adlercreutzia sp. R25]MEC4294443.1 GNAT family N-acetyltransferase [Adlercreutzia sp. R22]